MQFMSLDPASSHSEDVRVFGKRHQLGLAFEETEGMWGQFVEVEDFERAGDGVLLWL